MTDGFALLTCGALPYLIFDTPHPTERMADMLRCAPAATDFSTAVCQCRQSIFGRLRSHLRSKKPSATKCFKNSLSRGKPKGALVCGRMKKHKEGHRSVHLRCPLPLKRSLSCCASRDARA